MRLEAKRQDKQRVPRSPPPRTKEPRDGKKEEDRDEDKDSDDDNDCFLDCFFGILSSGSSEEPAHAPPIAPVPAAPPGWRIGDLAVLVPVDPTSERVELWSGPGGASEGYEPAGTLDGGLRVRILETHALPGREWVRVAPEDGAGPSGWIAASAIDRPPPPPPPPRGPITPAERHPGERPRILLLANVGASMFAGPHDVAEEYKDPAFQMGFSVSRRVGQGLQAGGVAAYGTARGYPGFDYLTPTRNDFPRESRVHVLNLGLRVAGYTPVFKGNTRFFSALGPGAYWVHERATVDFADLQGGTVVATGTRTESLSRLRPGAEVATGFLWWLGGRRKNRDDFMGIVLRGTFIAWSSEQERSLTFDFIGDRTPVSVEIGVVYAHEWF